MELFWQTQMVEGKMALPILFSAEMSGLPYFAIQVESWIFKSQSIHGLSPTIVQKFFLM